MSEAMRIGVAGLGTVGQGVVSIIQEHTELLAARTGQRIEIAAVSMRDPSKKRDVPLDGIRVEADARVLASADDIDVVLELIGGEEGIAREMVSRIQNLRKDAGFEVTDRIDLKIQRDGKTQEALMRNVQYVKSETLTEELDFEDQLEEGTPVEFDEIQTKLLIVKR